MLFDSFPPVNTISSGWAFRSPATCSRAVGSVPDRHQPGINSRIMPVLREEGHHGLDHLRMDLGRSVGVEIDLEAFLLLTGSGRRLLPEEGHEVTDLNIGHGLEDGIGHERIGQDVNVHDIRLLESNRPALESRVYASAVSAAITPELLSHR